MEKENSKIKEETVKIETCYLCNHEFNINKKDSSHYHYGKYPICDSCSESYAFFKS
ncbi:MAG: hypothetical protein LBV42_04895 [Methanobrevibacter sp.]|jgi:hypothetical protein|nr:hypothetical protein [Methanobrevibacter sp.]